MQSVYDYAMMFIRGWLLISSLDEQEFGRYSLAIYLETQSALVSRFRHCHMSVELQAVAVLHMVKHITQYKHLIPGCYNVILLLLNQTVHTYVIRMSM